jgi:uncharacterized protein
VVARLRGRPEVRAIALAGSWARAEARAGSDLDLVVLTETPDPPGWFDGLGLDDLGTRQWGILTERRLATPGGLELDVGFAPPSWAGDDPGTARVVRDGIVALHDPDGLLLELLDLEQ